MSHKQQITAIPCHAANKNEDKPVFDIAVSAVLCWVMCVVSSVCPQHSYTSLADRPAPSKNSMNRTSNHIRTILNSPSELKRQWRQQHWCVQGNYDGKCILSKK